MPIIGPPRSYTCPCESVPPLRTRCPDRIRFPRDLLGEMSVKDKPEGSRSSQAERAFRLWCRPDACEERRKDRLCRKSLWPQHSSEKVSTKLRESAQERLSIGKVVQWQEYPSSISLACLLIGWHHIKRYLDMNTKVDPRVRQLAPVSHLCPAPTSPAGSLEGGLNCTPHGCHILLVRKQMGRMEGEVLGRKRIKAVVVALCFSKRKRILPFL